MNFVKKKRKESELIIIFKKIMKFLLPWHANFFLQTILFPAIRTYLIFEKKKMQKRKKKST